MSDPALTAEAQPGSGRTLLVGSIGLCPVCHEAPLRGRQEVCSAACRRAKARQRLAAAQQARDREIRSALGLIITLAQDALVRLDQEARLAGTAHG